jgi:beta-galactosidase
MKRRSLAILAAWIVFGLAANAGAAAETVSLAGEWRFALDRDDVGLGEHWFAKNLPDKIRLPGILQAQGYGDDIRPDTPWVLTLGDAWWQIQPPALREHFSQPGRVEVPFLAQPPKHYLGAAWYQRDLEIPTHQSGLHFTLLLERAHWQSQVWIDDQPFPANDSLGAPHVTDLGLLAPGRHRLTIRVDNRRQLPAVGHLLDSHSISDALGAAWNGIVGKIELRATPPVWIDDVQVYPDLKTKTARVTVQLGNATGKAGSGYLFLPGILSDSRQVGIGKPITWETHGGVFERTLNLEEPLQTWDEFHPVLKELWVSLTLNSDSNSLHYPADVNVVKFGLREITHHDQDLLLNGRPINLRLTHFGGDFPLTGYPAMDVAAWKKIIQTCKDYGLNGIRFHSWCPPEAAFTAADELGFYLQPECGLWADFGNPVMRQCLNDETARLLKNYGNHPSFLLLSPSNEPKNYPASRRNGRRPITRTTTAGCIPPAPAGPIPRR